MKRGTVAIMALAAMFGAMGGLGKPSRKERLAECPDSLDRICAAQAKRERKAAKRKKELKP